MTTKYMVLRRLIFNGREYWPPLLDMMGRITHCNIIELPVNNDTTNYLYHSGWITDDLPIIRGNKIYHPEDKRIKRIR